MRLLLTIFLVTLCAGCANRHAGPPPPTAATSGPYYPQPTKPADWGPAYVAGMEHGPASIHLSQAFGRAEGFLAKQPFSTEYAKRACSGGGKRFVEVHFALLADGSGRTLGTVRVDTVSGECVWLGTGNR